MVKVAAKAEDTKAEDVAKEDVPATEENTDVSGWDTLFEGAVAEKRSSSRSKPKVVDVPQSLVERVERLYREKKRERLPIRDVPHFEQLRDALYSACEKSELNIVVRCMQVADEKDKDKQFIQYTVSGKRGRPAKQKTDDAKTD